MTINEYIDKLNARYRTGISTEHSYRGELLNLIESLAPDVMVTNEPTRVACGAPDYIITKGKIPVGYIEAKDIGKPLDSKDFKEQFDRYRTSLSNLIITDYLEFRLFIDGAYVSSVTIGSVQGNKIVAQTAYFAPFSDLIKDFCSHVGQTIKSASKLSRMMAGKARLMANVIERALTIGSNDNLVNEAQNLNLHNQYESFKQYLIHDITEKGFADIYAQTIAYGMFAARLNDPSLADFSRFEAAELIPKSNPFLRNLFQYIASYNLDDRIKWIVDELADIFRATNVAELLQDFGKSTLQNDPIIHFYETFLAEYDPKLRKSRGVYYTPEPVVKFIVRAVDDILKTEFGLQEGLADTSKIRIKVPQQGKMVEQEVHRVQILDPAAGTGTFLAEVIKQIYELFDEQQGVWSNYVEEQLIPRLNGFEILMASYAMAHLKLELLLRETGYIPKKQLRLKLYLTNSLEEHHQDTGTLFASWLSTEANEANHVKRDTPVMVVLGNPPYSVSSSNKGGWIEYLISDYKKDLNEKNIQPLSDDYLKFIRYGQYYIEHNGEGILAYISNNSFIDGTIHRQIRKCLLESFDLIYILDLHGNMKKKEKCIDGSTDQNVFDIMQGVSINIFIKRKNKTSIRKVFHNEVFGLRVEKYSFLNTYTVSEIKWNELFPEEPNFFFTKKDFNGLDTYEQGFKIDNLFILNSSGIKTQKDDACIFFTKEEAEQIKVSFLELTVDEIRNEFKYEDVRDWKIALAKEDLLRNPVISTKLLYRPFDFRFMNYTGTTKGIMGYPRYKGMKHVLKENISLILVLQAQAANLDFFDCIFISKLPSDTNMFRRGGPLVFPLYLYPETKNENIIDFPNERTPNFKAEILEKIIEILGLAYTREKEVEPGGFAPIDILDYIYAVLHSHAYRTKYKEFLMIDFPRIPYPKDKDTFWQLVKLGSELRQIHLFESPLLNKFITSYSATGSNEVAKVRYENSKAWINDTQYFDKVPKVSWEFYIGGYQPAQKWLKDRKGRILSFDDIIHYQKIIVALSETDRIMKEIDKIPFMDVQV